MFIVFVSVYVFVDYVCYSPYMCVSRLRLGSMEQYNDTASNHLKWASVFIYLLVESFVSFGKLAESLHLNFIFLVQSISIIHHAVGMTQCAWFRRNGLWENKGEIYVHMIQFLNIIQ